MGKIILCIVLAGNLFSGCITPQRPDTTRTKDDSAAHFLDLGNKYARDGLYSEAIEQYRKAIRSPQHREVVYRNMGIIQVKTGDYKGAVESFSHANKRFDGNFEYHFYFAEAHRGIAEYDRAIYHYNRANELKPKELKVLKPLAWSYFKIRYYAKALSFSKEMLRLKPKDVQVYLIVARTLVKTNRDNSAMKVIQKAKKFADDIELAHLKSIEGDILRQKGEFANAASAYRYALKKEPLLGGALYGLGLCLIHDNQLDRGIKYLERAMRVRPEHARTYLELGRAYEQKDRKKHLAYMKQFVKLSRNDPELMGEAEKVQKNMQTN